MIGSRFFSLIITPSWSELSVHNSDIRVFSTVGLLYSGCPRPFNLFTTSGKQISAMYFGSKYLWRYAQFSILLSESVSYDRGQNFLTHNDDKVRRNFLSCIMKSKLFSTVHFLFDETNVVTFLSWQS